MIVGKGCGRGGGRQGRKLGIGLGHGEHRLGPHRPLDLQSPGHGCGVACIEAAVRRGRRQTARRIETAELADQHQGQAGLDHARTGRHPVGDETPVDQQAEIRSRRFARRNQPHPRLPLMDRLKLYIGGRRQARTDDQRLPELQVAVRQHLVQGRRRLGRRRLGRRDQPLLPLQPLDLPDAQPDQQDQGRDRQQGQDPGKPPHRSSPVERSGSGEGDRAAVEEAL